VHSRENAHGHFVRILTRDTLVHLEEVAVAGFNGIPTETLDGIPEIQENGESGVANAAAIVGRHLGVAGRDIARYQVSETGVLALQVIIPFILRNILGTSFITLLLRYPNAPIVPKRFGHQGQFGLVVTRNRNTGRVDLRVARVGEVGAPFVAAPGRRNV